MSAKKITRHWIEAYVDRDQASYTFICEHPEDCGETKGEGCAPKDFFDNDGFGDTVSFPSNRQDVFGRVEVAVEWEGGDDEAYCVLKPADPPPAPAVTRDDLAKLVETALRGFTLRIGPNASDLLVAGKWQTLPLTGAECREIASVVAEGLAECVDIRLRPTEGSDTK